MGRVRVAVAGASVAGLALAARLVDEAREVTLYDDGLLPAENSVAYGCSRALRSLLRRVEAELLFPLPKVPHKLEVGLFDRSAIARVRRAALPSAHTGAISWLSSIDQPARLVDRLWAPLIERAFGVPLAALNARPVARFLGDYLFDEPFAATSFDVDPARLAAHLRSYLAPRAHVAEGPLPPAFPEMHFVVFADRSPSVEASPYVFTVGRALLDDYPPGLESAVRSADAIAMRIDETDPPAAKSSENQTVRIRTKR